MIKRGALGRFAPLVADSANRSRSSQRMLSSKSTKVSNSIALAQVRKARMEALKAYDKVKLLSSENASLKSQIGGFKSQQKEIQQESNALVTLINKIASLL